MSTLTEFLLARISEDEQQAQGGGWGDPIADDCWGPTRVLAECEAKRRIIEWYSKSYYAAGGPTLDVIGWTDEQLAIGRAVERHVLRPLAAPYSDHSDFRDEWRVQ